MNYKRNCFRILLSVLLCVCHNLSGMSHNMNSHDTYDDLKANFQQPAQKYGVNCWWWWLNGNVTKEAIRKDLEAMRLKNFQGAMIFDADGHNQRGNKNIPSGPTFASKEWIELFSYALDEAKRLGLVMGFNIQSGWNLGGPCVTPQYSAKQLTYTERLVTGGKTISIQLDNPRKHNNFYKDIAVLAFPAEEENKTLKRISKLDLKMGYHELGGSAPDCRFLLEAEPQDKPAGNDKDIFMVSLKNVLNISDRMDDKGVLRWDAPEGKWNILRIGYTCTRSVVSTSSGKWQGSVLDYMSKDAFDFYWNTVVEPIFSAIGEEHLGTTLKFMETDSWECGGMNWTDSFAEEFRDYCGYDLTAFLPVFAGHIIENMDVSNAFLADFRKTMGHLVAINHYARFAEHAHKYDMGIQPESAGPHAGPLDGIKNYGFSDIMMSEFWAPSPHRPKPENRFFIKQASSAAHIYGKRIVGAESFTTIGPHWNDELWHDQKPSFDHEICAGLNRVYLHTFTCSPKEQGLPGQEYFAGTHINPQVTWWSKSSPFFNYISRVQSLVQEGDFVADVLYYYGDHVPNVFPYKYSDPAGAMFGFDYDVTDETILLRLDVRNGEIVTPNKRRYKILVLPDHRVLSLAVLQKLENLISKGATVLGYKPEKAVSLVGGEDGAKEFARLPEQIWGTAEDSVGQHVYGKGKVVWGMTAKEYLLSQDVRRDFSIQGNSSKDDYDYIHYTIGDTHIYFVSNQTDLSRNVMADFRVCGMQPEIWNALDGSISEARAFRQADGITTIPLTLDPYGSVIIVFHKKISKKRQGDRQHNSLEYNTIQTLEGAWTVGFDTERGGPGEVTFSELTDWTSHPDKGIKYYSGTAVYKKSFKTTFDKKTDKRYFLQLGDVKDVGIASIRLNGKDKGIVWTKLFRVEVTDDLTDGDNILEVEVVNSWYNRVAGDEMSASPQKYTKTNIVLGHDFRGAPLKDIPLEPSGLLGPVTILTGEESD